MKHKRILRIAVVLALACITASKCAAQTADNSAPARLISPAANAPSPVVKEKVAQEYGKLPLSFEANRGQTDPKVKFLSRGPGYKLFLLPGEAVLMFQKERRAKPAKGPGALPGFPEASEREGSPAEIIRMSLLGARANADIAGVEEMSGKSNYFIGNDPKQWRNNVPNYGRVRYGGVYPGIDLVYHGNQRQLEYDFVVAPGADPRRIALGMKGAKKLELTADGDLLLYTSAETVRLRKPVVYQESGAKRQEIDGGFVLVAKNTVKFSIGKYDRSQPLIIDPVLSYSTFLGGSADENSIGFIEGGLAVDANGNAYVMGFTDSIDFPVTAGAFQTKCGTDGTCNGGQTKVFVAKLNPAGNALLYSTYLGGSGTDSPGNFGLAGITIDSAGNAYLTGATNSIDFPTTPGAFQGACNSCSNGFTNAFVTELNPAGSGLVFSTYLGGGNDEGDDVKVDSTGVYVTGITFSANFPTTSGAFQTSIGGTGGNVFVTKLNHTGSAPLLYSTYLGGRDGESPVRIAVDSSGSAYVIGSTNSSNFPTTPASVQPAATSGGVFKTTNGGTNWAASNSGLTDLAVQTLAIEQLSPLAQTIYAGTFGQGVFKSVNGGASWAAMNTGLTTPNIQTLAIDQKTTGTTATLYAGTLGGGAFKSTNGGASWTAIPSTSGLTAGDIRAFAIDPLTAGVVYAGAFGGVFKSTNGGANWMAMNTGLAGQGSRNIQALIIDPTTTGLTQVVYVGTRGGVFKSTDGGTSWILMSNGLTTLNVDALAIDPAFPLTLYAGTLGRGVFKSTDGANTWAQMNTGLPLINIRALAIDPSTTQIVYAGGNGGGVFKSADGANTWATVNTSTGPARVVRALAIDPSTTSNVYAGTVLIDAFVTKLNSTGTALVYSTFLGGLGSDFASGLAVDSSGNAYVAGFTNSPDFRTTAGAFQTSPGGGNDAFVAKLDPTGSSLVYSTYLGGSGGDFGNDIAVDASGNAWVAGSTNSLNFPTVLPLRAALDSGGCNGGLCLDAFVAELNPAGSALLFSTYIGGRKNDEALGIALAPDPLGGVDAYVTGYTESPDFPSVNAAQPTFGGGNTDAFVLKISNPPSAALADLAITATSSPNPVLAGGLLTFNITVTNNGPSTATGVTFYTVGQAQPSAVKLTTVSATPSQGTCDSHPICNFGPLASGSSATLTIVTTPNAPGTLVGTLGVGGNESDPNPANNTFPVNVTVNPAADLSLVGTDSPSPVPVSSQLTYTLFVNNNGQIPATNVTLTDTLPTGTALFSPATTSQGTCTFTAPTVTCALGTVNNGAGATVTIIVTTPSVMGTITNSSSVTESQTDPTPGDNTLQQNTDVVAAPPNPNNARLKGPYAFLFQGATADGALMAFAGSLVADGNGNLTSGVADTNLSATAGALIGVPTGVITNQLFTGTYNVGADNRGTMTITTGTGGPTLTLTFRFALGAFNSLGVATKARFIEFDTSGRHGAGVIEMQDPAVLGANASNATINGSFAFGNSGEDINHNHFAGAGRFAADGAGNITGGLEDADTAGVVSANLTFTGTYNLPAGSPNGRGTFTNTFVGIPAPIHGAFYVVSANESFSINTDPRSATVVLSSGQNLKQRTATFSNAWLNGVSVFNLSGAATSTSTDVLIGLATTDGLGNITVVSDENNGGVINLNQPGNVFTYSVATSGRTTFTGGTGSHQPILYLADLNKGFLVGTDTSAGVGSVEPQVGGPFTNASFSGSAFFGEVTASALDPSVGVATADGAGKLVGTSDEDHVSFLAPDQAFTGSYAVSPSGRTTLNFANGDTNILYVISPTKTVAIGTKNGSTNDTVTVIEGSTLPATTADLAITKSASVSNPVVGEQFTYTLSVKNNGPGLATGVVVTDSLPATVTFVSANTSQGACSVPPATTVVCSLGAIPNGASVDILIVVTAAAAGSATNTASVAGNETDPTPTDNTATTTPAVTVTSATDLTLITTATPDSVILGSNLTFSVTVVNVGNLPATNVVITDTLPAGVTFTPPPNFTCTIALPTLTCPVGGLASGASVVATFVVTPTVTGTITNTATVTLTETDPTPGDNMASASATVLPSTGTTEDYVITDVNTPNVLVYGAANNTLLPTAHAGSNANGVAISPNGRLAFVGNVNSNYISVIDLTLNAEIARIRGVQADRNLALNGDGTRLIVPSILSDEVDIIDTSNFQVLKRVSLNGVVGDDPNNPNDIGLGSVVVVGNFAYLNSGVFSTVPLRVAVVDLTSFAASSIPGSATGFTQLEGHMGVTPDGRFLVVPRSGPNRLLVIDTSTNTVARTVSMPSAPLSVAITRNASDPRGIFGYVVLSGGQVSALDFNPGSATFGQLIANATVTIPATLTRSDIGLTSDGTRAIITTAFIGGTNNVFVLDTQLLRTSPASAVVNQFLADGAAGRITGVVFGFVQSQPPGSAPVVSTASPSVVVNNVATTVHITGSGFAAGAMVRVGSLDPVAATNVTSAALDAAIPQFAPAQNLVDVIVTNPNSAAAVLGQQESGILRRSATIANSPLFLPANEVAITAFGDNSVAILNDSTKSVSSVPVSSGAFGMAISADGLRAYVESFRSRVVDVVNLNTRMDESTITPATDTIMLGQTDAIATAPNPATGNPSEFLLTSYMNSVSNITDLRVVVIDSAPTSPTFNAIVASFPAGLTTNAFPGGLAVRADGTFAYANDANTGNLVIFNLMNGAVNVIQASALGDATFQGHIEVTQDKQSLLLMTPAGSIRVYDVGVNPTNPTLVTTITGTPPAGLSPLFFSSFRVVGNRLFAFDTNQLVVQAFNFDRVASNFSPLGSSTIPGNLGQSSGGLAVTPDGALLYATVGQDDAVAVLDAAQLTSGSASALITKFRAGLNTSAIVISPAKALVANLAITKTAVPTTVFQGATVTYTLTVTNSGPSSSTGVTLTDVLPAGLTFVSVTPSQGNCTGTTTVTCSLGTLANGATASVSLAVTATATGSITNTATVTENETNSTPANATASTTITVTNASACGSVPPTIQWTGAAVPADNQWTTAANWNLARVPVATDDVCIDTPFAGTTVTLANSAQSVNTLTAASNFVLSGAATATSLTVANGSTFLNALTLNGAALNSGHLAINGLFTSSGTSSIGIPTAFLLANGGIAISGTLTVIGNRLVNSGPGTLNSGSVVQLSGGATLDNNSSLTFLPGTSSGILTSPGSSVINRAGAAINVTVAGAASISAPVTNLGAVNVSGVLTLSGVYNQTSGSTTLNSNSNISNTSAFNINGGILAGNAVISGNVSVSNGGIVSPGFSPGTIGVGGIYSQTAAGIYNAEIGGLTAGTQYDQIKDFGSAALGGTLNVLLINGFVPVVGNSFSILTCGGTPPCLTGTFSTVNLPALPNGLRWTVTYGPTSVVLSVSATAAGCAPGTNQWTGAAGDNQWATPANWSTGAVPTAADNVCIGTAFSTSTITIGSLATAANQTIASLVANSTINFTFGPLAVTGPATFASALNISGGTLTLNGAATVQGTTNLSGGTLALNGATTVQGATNLSGGTLTGTGNVTLTGLLTWTGGTMSGAGTTSATGGMSFTSPQAVLDTRTLNVSGTTTFGSSTAGATLLVQNGAVINNLAGATWSILTGSNGSGIIYNGGTVGTFNNAGTLQMTGGSADTISVVFNNSGAVNANVVTLIFSGGGSCTTACAGSFNVASAATLSFAAGTYALSGSITGAGTVAFNGGTANLTGTYNIAGGTTVAGGTANFTGTLTSTGPLAIGGGTANFSNVGGAVTTSALTLSGGTLTGTSTVTVSGLLTWSGGVMSGAGMTNANGGMNLPNASVTLDTRTLNVSGTTTFGNASGGSNLFVANGAVINNLAGATWNLVNGSANGIINGGGVIGTFNNAGTFQMTGGVANQVSVAFNNTGTVNANAGTLGFNGAYTQTAGATVLNGGAISSSTTLNINGGTLGGTGSIAANISVTTGGLLSPGFPGTIALKGSYTQRATGSYLAEIAGPTAGTQYGQLSLDNFSFANLGGTLNVTLLNGFVPAAGNSFTIVNCPVTNACINGTFGTVNFPALPTGLAWNLAYNSNSVVLNVVATTGVSITKTASLPTTHIGGGNFTYTVTVTNNNASPAANVTVTDPLPAAVTFVSAVVSPTGQGSCSGTTTISCALGTLASGASVTVTITVTPAAVGSAVNTATVTFNGTGSNSASATVQIQATADLALLKTAQPNPVNAGSNLSYTLTVTNNGPSPATGVTLTDPLPAGTTLVAFAPTQGTCSGTTTITCSLGTIQGIGTAGTVLVGITVTPTGSGPLSNTGSVASNEFDPNTANNTSTATVTVNPVADLALTKTASPSPATVGSNLTYTITVTNNGPSQATGVTLTDALPAGVTLVSATPSAGTCTISATISCNLGTLANGAKGTATIVVTPTATGTVANTATVAANETDPNLANNTSTVSTPVVASADLSMTQTVAPISVLLGGGNLTYTVTVTNNGPSPATGIVVTDTVPAGVTLISAFPSTNSVCNTANAPNLTCQVLPLASGATATVTVIVKPNTTGSFTNSATVTANEPDPNPANNSASATATVTPAADLSLTETATPQSVSAGSNVTFGFTVTNNGPSTATGVTLTDTLPAGMVVVSATPSQGTCTVAVSCNLGALANGATATVTIVAKALPSGNLTNAGNVSANEADPVPSNNTASANFTVVPSADLAISASASPNPVPVGVNLTFTTTVTNLGPSPATAVTLSGSFSGSATATFVSLTPSQGSCQGTTQFSCVIGAMTAGASVTVTAVFTPTAGGPAGSNSTFGTTESVSAQELDPNTANNSVTLFATVLSSPVVTLSTSNLNYASQPVGTSSTTQGVTLTNTSSVLPLTNLTITANGDFVQTNNCGTGLAAQSSCSIMVTFTPTATGTRTGAITISDNAAGSPQMISLTGIGINAPAITLSPGSLIFSSRLVGSTSPALTVSMSNSGNATLNIASIAITGTNSGDFSQTNTCGQTLAPSVSCAISVSFKPTASGQRTAGVAITSDARGSVPIVTLSGTGLAVGLDLSSSLLIFDNQTVGTTSAPQIVTLSNSGATAVAITGITASGDYAQTNNCGNSVAASSNCAIRVTFTPTGTGTRTGSISIVSGDSSTPLTVNLTGTGVVVTLSLSPASLTFNEQKVGTSSQAQSIALTDTGGAALTINSIVPAGDFLEADNCGGGLAGGGGCSINVTFVPTATGIRTGSITITSNAQGSPHTVKLTGNGVPLGPAVSLACPSGSGAPASSCVSLTFSAQAVSTTSAAHTVALTNVGNDTLNITGIAASGDFTALSNCPAALAAGASCSISVTFTPSATGTRSGSLVIKDNAGDSPQSVGLSGTGTPFGPAISLSATALPFGSQLVGTMSNSQLVTVTNPGNATLTFTSIKATGDFTETDTCANGVSANSSCTISVIFAPTAAGARAGAITISDNAPGSPHSVTLSGEGTDITISVPPGSSTSATVSAGQSATFALSVAPSGGFNGLVTISCNSAIPASTCTPSPNSLTLNAPVTVTTTVTTTAPSHSVVLPVAWPLPRNFAPLRAIALTLLMLVAFLMFFVAAPRRRRTWIGVTAALFLAAFVSGCAGGFRNPGVVGPTLGTAPNNYTVTVVITAPGGATRSMPLTVIVQ